jgi:hypothetical protein
MQFFRHRRRVDADVPGTLGPDTVAGPPDRRDAFSAGLRVGRHEERARHRGHPMIGLIVALVAVAGAAMLALAIHEGSFTRGGQVVDQNLTAVAGQAQNAGAGALAKTGQAIQNAGSTLEQQASNASNR